MLNASFASGNYLERAVLSELRGEPSAAFLRKALRLSEETVDHMRALEAAFDAMLQIQRSAPLTPKFVAALGKILKDHPDVERVDPTKSRFSQIGKGNYRDVTMGSLGNSLEEIVGTLKRDLALLREQTERMNDEFRKAIAVGDAGGFAAMVLSGRSAFPELVMQHEELIGIYQRLYGRACLTTIAATMLVYPDGLEWLPKPSKK